MLDKMLKSCKDPAWKEEGKEENSVYLGIY